MTHDDDRYASAGHVVLRQRWVLTLPTGETYDAGYSYHLLSADHIAYVSEAASAAERQGDLGHEEPLGEPELYHISNASLERLERQAHGYRSR